MALDQLQGFITLLLYMIPAMTANGAPVAAGKFIKKKTSIDFGKKFLDQKRILGDGKTWEGLIIGVLTGGLTGFIIGIPLGQPLERAITGLIAGLGAMIGDIAGSFIKRRLGLERGASAPLLDQLDFYVGALLLLYIYGIKFNILAVVVLAVVVVILHRTTNLIAYKLGLKNVPR